MRTVIFLLAVVVGLTSCAQDRVESDGFAAVIEGLIAHSVPELTVGELKEDLDNVVFLDAREIEEFQVSHLANAAHVGFEKVDLSCLDSLDKSSKIVVYCSVGYRSEKVAEKIKNKGFTNVSNLYGGIFEWVNQGNAVEDSSGVTNSTHAYDRTWGIWLTRGKKVY
jgi:rhodanese-related sulfurtransferase